MKITLSGFIFIALAIAVGGFTALIVWTLIVKNQIQQTVAASSTGTTLGAVGALLSNI